MVGYGDMVLDREVIIDFEVPGLDHGFVGNSMSTLEAQLVMPFLIGSGSLSNVK